MERDFKGIWIQKEIWLNKELKVMEKLFLVEIDSLDNLDGCYATNEYFSDFFGLSKNRCSEIIKSLEKKGLVSIRYKYKNNSKAIEKRIIKVVGISTMGIRDIDRPIRDIDRPIRNIDRGYSEKCEENNTIYNNTIYNNIYSQVIEYLNEKANKNYKATRTKTKDLIRARVKENYTLEDFEKVIDIKVEEWSGTEMEKFLRPETLFSNKFESYLNQGRVYGTNRERNNRWSSTKDNEKNETGYNYTIRTKHTQLSDEDSRRAEELI